jgi:hypothetical protein
MSSLNEQMYNAIHFSVVYLRTLSMSSLYSVSKEERSVYWEITISVILAKNCIHIYLTYVYTCVPFRTVSETELFHCTAHCTPYRRAKRHVLTRVAKCIDVDGGIFEKCFILGELYQLYHKCGNLDVSQPFGTSRLVTGIALSLFS